MKTSDTWRSCRAALGLLAGTSVFAADGILEINQACALNGGCFSGDAAGYPVTITAPGSYRLTGNLDLTSAPSSVPAIVISAPGVTLDLGGFEMAGPVSCTGAGAAIDCAPANLAGYGVLVEQGANGVTIRNGTIRAFAGQGIGSAGQGVRITGITAFHNASDGIATQEFAVVTGSVAFENLSDGFDIDTGSVVENVVAFGNGLDGVEVDGQGTVVNNSTARNNGSRGYNLASLSKFGTNISLGNALPDNCGGGICTQRRRFYAEPGPFEESEVSGELCDTGFRLAFTVELMDLSGLAFDHARRTNTSRNSRVNPFWAAPAWADSPHGFAYSAGQALVKVNFRPPQLDYPCVLYPGISGGNDYLECPELGGNQGTASSYDHVGFVLEIDTDSGNFPTSAPAVWCIEEP